MAQTGPIVKPAGLGEAVCSETAGDVAVDVLLLQRHDDVRLVLEQLELRVGRQQFPAIHEAVALGGADHLVGILIVLEVGAVAFAHHQDAVVEDVAEAKSTTSLRTLFGVVTDTSASIRPVCNSGTREVAVTWTNCNGTPRRRAR